MMAKLKAIYLHPAMPIATIVAAAAVNIPWFVGRGPPGETISGVGAMLVVAGLLIAARPFVRVGVRGAAEQMVQAPQFTPYLDAEGRTIKAAREAYEKKVRAAIPDVRAERVLAFWVIVIGTLVNGYGPLIARTLRL